MSLRFTQKEVESELRDCFKHGYIRDVSILSGIGETYLDRGINPNDDHKSAAFQFLQVQCALDEKDSEMGELHWSTVCKFRELSRAGGDEHLCVDRETTNFTKESVDLTISHMKGEPLFKRLSEALEARTQADRAVRSIIEAINKEKGL
jgi:hypothetical protein